MAMWKTPAEGPLAVQRILAPVVHLVEQFAVPSTLASARLIQECGGAATDYAYPAFHV
ncbi:UNVERIFIED_ORG: hypothetical protein ABIB19_001252 [Arthrobacter sp. UYEF10]